MKIKTKKFLHENKSGSQGVFCRAVFTAILLGSIALLPVYGRVAAYAETPPTAKRVILMIADGWGIKHIEATNKFMLTTPAYQTDPQWTTHYISTYPYLGEYDPSAYWGVDFNYVLGNITDSAAAATVLYSGHKTRPGRVSVDHNNARLFALGEKAKLLNRAVGAITTVPASHATPGAWVAHNDSRDNTYAIADEGFFGNPNQTCEPITDPPLPEDQQCTNLKHGGSHGETVPPADVLIGDGATGYITNAMRSSLGDPLTYDGVFVDCQFGSMSDCGDELQLEAAGASKLAGLFDRQNLYATVPNPDSFPPTLAEMTDAALTVLDKNQNGFVLMIEGGAVDWAGHANNMDNMIGEMIDFNDAVDTVINWVNVTDPNWDNTLLIVTGDHECGYLTAGFGVFPDVDLGEVSPATLSLEQVEINEGRRASWDDDGDREIDPGETVYWAWNSDGHSNSLIPLYCRGVGCDLFPNYYENPPDPVRGSYLDNRHVSTVIDAVLVDAIAPTIVSAPVTAGTVGQIYSYDVDAWGKPASNYALATSPAGMTVDAATGLIQWAPSATGDFLVSVEASNGILPDDTQDFTISVGLPTGESPLDPGVPQGDAVSLDGWAYYFITSSAADKEIEVALTNLSADVDLYVRAGSRPDLNNYDCRPYTGGTTPETCKLTNDVATTWFIGVHGYQAGSYTLTATFISPTSLQSGVPQGGFVSQGDWAHYFIASSATDTEIEVALSNLSADVDLYVREGSTPDLANYDCRPYTAGTTAETCILPNTGATNWYVGVNGYQAGSYTLTATLIGPPADVSYYCDGDTDTHISLAVSGTCTGAGCEPGGCVLPAGDDCNDGDPTIYPGAAEIPDDGIDQDCNGFDTITCIVDADQDGYGTDVGTTTLAGDGSCDTADSESTTLDDCDDTNPAINPGAAEVCADTVDNDCDGLTDGADPDCAGVSYYCDGDTDTHISLAVSGTCMGAGCEPGGCVLTAGDDCNDGDPTIYPGATETPDDGIDQDCNGFDTITCIVDADQDGYGTDVGTTTLAGDGSCDTADSESASSDDCDDGDAAINPGAAEVCADTVDNDCDGLADGADPDCAGVSYYCDGDTDTHISLAVSGTCTGAGCEPGGCVLTAGDDCNDGDPTIYPGATEIPDDGIDQDCNGFDTITCIVDADQDGYGTDVGTTTLAADGSCDTADSESTTLDDCDDGDAAINPGAAEVCADTVDNDCDGLADGADPDCAGVSYYCDGDTDTHVSLAVSGTCTGAGCEPGGCVLTAGDDCNDGDPTIYPGAAEIPDDGIDQDCNGFDTITCIVDADQDGYGTDVGTTTLAGDGSCDTADSESTTLDDCDDGDAAINPGAAEVCADTVDNDCDGLADGADPDCAGVSYYCDGDTDTHISLAVSGTCTGAGCEPGGCVLTAGDDCNDGDPTIHPGAAEIPDDEIDQDCNGFDTITCIVDGDQDGYGTDVGTTTLAGDGSCDTADSESTTLDDCDDGDAAINPGAAEVCADTVDNDCDGLADGADPDCAGVSYYCDGDTDTHISLAVSGTCTGAGCEPGGCVLTAGDDCNDGDPTIYPGAAEIPDDGIDQDCNGFDTITCIVDGDQDGYGTDVGTTTLAGDGSCDTADSESTTLDDCDDGDAAINPGAAEVCADTVDNDCDGLADGADPDCAGVSYYCDGDTDTHISLAVSGTCTGSGCEPGGCVLTAGDDCNDGDPTIYTGATEIPDDGIDQDCNGFDTITCIVDGDQDGYGTDVGTTTLAGDGSCDTADSESTTLDDCDDGDAAINPGAAEVCADTVDNDCDGLADGADPDCAGVSYYCDGDTDTHISLAVSGTCTGAGCEPGGCVLTAGDDCNDGDPTIHPGAAEIPDDEIDQDCNGFDTITCIVDGDQDGYGTDVGTTTLAGDGSCDTADSESTTLDDCDDGDAAINPGAAEVCADTVDNDCDGLADGADPDCAGVSYYCDGDTDTHISLAVSGTCTGAGCEPGGCVLTAGDDCNDGDPTIHPGAAEIPDDEIDQDCNGFDTITCIVDGDQDGYGTDVGTTTLAGDGSCDTADSESTTLDDCDDGDAAINPGAAEVCADTVDNDCDGLADGADPDCAGVSYYCDGDTDTHISLAVSGTCTGAGCEPGGCVLTAGDDCNDGDPTIYTGATEIPDDGIDQDCNGFDTITCIVDGDQDGYGTDVGTTTLAGDGSCDTADSESTTLDDCDDGDAAINPGAAEVCADTVDNDCDGLADGADPDCAGVSYYCDGDTDTHISLAVSGTCTGAGCEPGGCVLTAGDDCNDGDPTIYTGATEIPDDGIDQDCNGFDTITCIVDGDQDGYGTDVGTTTLAGDGSCDTADSESTTLDDCDDGDAAINPGAAEVCADTVDNDCDGLADGADPDCAGVSYYCDGDTDTHVSLAVSGTCTGAGCEPGGCVLTAGDDCNDGDPTIHPGAAEIPDDGIDQDCNGFDTITCIVDADQDGYGTDVGTTTLAGDGSCDTADSESTTLDDCDDGDAAINPGAAEVCADTVDNDCDGLADAADPDCTGDTPLQSGVEKAGAVLQDEWAYYFIDASATDAEIVVRLRNLSADMDLYVKAGAKPSLGDYDCRPYNGGTASETCTLLNSGVTTWYIGVHGYQAGSYTVKATLIGPSPLQSGVPQAGSVSQGEWAYSFITSSATDTEIEATITNLSADVDLYVKAGANPTLGDYDCRPYIGGTASETCTLPNSGATTWFIGVYGYRPGSYTVTATMISP